jgi:hypothetical protein
MFESPLKLGRLEKLPAEIGRKIKERLEQIKRHSPKLYPLFLRVYANRNSKAAAIKAKCLDCCCYQRKEVELCTVVACPLWHVRPYQKGEE